MEFWVRLFFRMFRGIARSISISISPILRVYYGYVIFSTRPLYFIKILFDIQTYII